MERDKIIYTGLCCKVNTKAAFIDMCMKTPALESRMLMSGVVRAEWGRQVYGMREDERTGILEVKVKMDEEMQEKIYEEMLGRKLDARTLERLSDFNRKLLEPVERMHQKEMKIDVIPFVAYGIVRNSRCRNRLEASTVGCAAKCLEAFRQSEYNTAGYLQRFLLDERRAARLAIGLLLLLREEETEEKYRMVLDIIYAGYKTLRNRMKKRDCLNGEYCCEIMTKDVGMEHVLAQMVIQMVIAEDMGIPFVYDYVFCQVVCILQSYEDDRKNGEVQDVDMTEGKRIYRKLLRKHWNPGSYYISAFLEEEEDQAYAGEERGRAVKVRHGGQSRDGVCVQGDKIENLLYQFGLEIRALSGLCLEKWEAEALCAIFEEEDWDRYRYLLLVATLCKYIQQIEGMYEQDIPEEVQYRASCEADALKHMEYELKRMEEKIRILERQKKEKEGELAEAEQKIERMRWEGERKKRQHEKEKRGKKEGAAVTEGRDRKEIRSVTEEKDRKEIRSVIEGKDRKESRIITEGRDRKEGRSVTEERAEKESRSVAEGRAGEESRSVAERRAWEESRSMAEGREGRESLVAVEEGREGERSRAVAEGREGEESRTVTEGREGEGSCAVTEGRESLAVAGGRERRESRAVTEEKYADSEEELTDGRKVNGDGKARNAVESKESAMAERLERSIVIGGHKNWQKKMRRCLPDSQFLASDYMHFDPAVLRNKKYIIVNTDILKHGLYYKIMSERKKGQKIVYVHGNNVDRVIQEIAEQI